MAWPHPITTLGFAVGLVSAYLIAVVMSLREEPTLLGAHLLPGGEADPMMTGEDERFLPAIIVQLGLGAIIGGLYPWVFHGIIGLEGMWITELPWTVMTGLLYGAILSLLAVALTYAGLFKVPDYDYANLASYLMIYGGFLGILIGVFRPIWFDIFLA